MDQTTIENKVMASFVGEVEAFKPGNVSTYSEGHDMTVQHFLRSAEISVPLLCKSGKGLGERIYTSATATQKAVGCNTNLGMLILFAPIIMAAESGFSSLSELREKITSILQAISAEDTEQVYSAIRLMSPGGLGETEEHDIKQAPDCGLLEAMRYASKHDFIAVQYCSGFADIFESGIVTIKDFVLRWNCVKWSTVSCYLMFLSSSRDSHIERKFGRQVAEKIRIKSGELAKAFYKSENPESWLPQLCAFDADLKSNNYNPGTSADLTAASLLIYNLACQ